jgi:hypothetical protein
MHIADISRNPKLCDNPNPLTVSVFSHIGRIPPVLWTLKVKHSNTESTMESSCFGILCRVKSPIYMTA